MKTEIPCDVINTIRRFMIDSRTGNIQINIKDGHILGYRVEDVVSLKAAKG